MQMQMIQIQISTIPSILAMDNEPARLFIGQEIPITTGESQEQQFKSF